MRKLLSDSIFDLEKCPYRKTHERESFPVGVLCKVQNWIWKQFSQKVLWNYCPKKNWSLLVYIFFLLNKKYIPKGSNFFGTIISQDFVRKLLSDSILNLAKYPNWKTFPFMCFPVRALLEVKNRIRKQFSHKVLYNLCSKKMGAFSCTFKRVKIFIAHCIFKLLNPWFWSNL